MTSIDNRKAPRRRVFKAGSIVINQGGIIDCTIWNISSTGACIEVVSPLGIPDEFTLASNDHVQRPCRIVWKNGKRIAVTFI